MKILYIILAILVFIATFIFAMSIITGDSTTYTLHLIKEAFNVRGVLGFICLVFGSLVAGFLLYKALID